MISTGLDFGDSTEVDITAPIPVIDKMFHSLTEPELDLAGAERLSVVRCRPLEGRLES